MAPHVSEWLILNTDLLVDCQTCLQPNQTFGHSVYHGGIKTVLPLLKWFLRHHVVLTWDFSHLKWCYCFIPWLSLDWNVSINICVLFFSIHPSPSHEKHIGVSWLTMAAEHVDFQHHLFFVVFFCFIFSISLFGCNTNCTASDLKWNSWCTLISTQNRESLVQRNIYIWITLAFQTLLLLGSMRYMQSDLADFIPLDRESFFRS